MTPSSYGMILAIAVSWLVSLPSVSLSAESVSYRREVMAALSKAGCNLGSCHGNANGKGGFKLSLRGEDPAGDYRALTRDLTGRRINRQTSDESLLLKKPLMQVVHEGGQRFLTGSPEHEVLRRWIEQGARDDESQAIMVRSLSVTPLNAIITAPETSVRLKVIATLTNGQTLDVSRWACYEPSIPVVEITEDGLVTRQQPAEVTVVVRYLEHQIPVRLAFIEPATKVASHPAPQNRIDEIVFAKLTSLNQPTAELCDDTTFIRRVSLDLLGVLPTADEARSFVASSDPDKRRKLVDDYLDRPEFAESWTIRWSDILRSEQRTLDRKGNSNFHTWLQIQITQDRPWNEMVQELLSSRGSTYAEPSSNFYRALRDPFSRAEATAQLFLGVRLQCAKCHSHPFDRWTQDDYYAWSNAFSQVDYKILENRRRDTNDTHEFDGEQIVFLKQDGSVKDPRTGSPRPARMLASDSQPLDKSADRLEVLANWVVADDNPYFAPAQVNRIWAQMMGRGLVDPVDDFRLTNPASHPELLDWLAHEFRNNGYRLKPVIRLIANSATYQLGSDTNAATADSQNYSHTVPRRMSAESLADSLSRLFEVPLPFAGYPQGTRAGELAGGSQLRSSRNRSLSSGDDFLKIFGKPPRQQSCDCERVTTPTLAQTFQMVSGPMLDGLLANPKNSISRLLNENRSDSDVIRELYWAALNREPTPDEFRSFSERLSHSTEAASKRATLEDLTWALVNSNEFLFRH